MVRDLHMAVADRAFTAVGPGGAPARVIHDGVAGALYGGVRRALEALPRGAGSAVARSSAQQAPALAQSPRGSLALAALNAYVGDALAATGERAGAGHDAAPPRRRPAARRRRAGAGAARTPGRAWRIFVHGLGETDASWRLRADAQRPGYGAGLQRDLGHTPIELRYNTGLHISDNGRALAGCWRSCTRRGPWRCEEIVIVGHSMGGLVARSACHYGQQRGPRAGRAPCATSSAWARRTSARRWRRASTRSAGRWAACPRRARWPTCSTCAAPGSRTCATGPAPRRTGATATPTSCSPTAATTCPSCRARASTSWRRRSAGGPATRWCDPRRPAGARPQRVGGGAGGARSASPSRTATTSAALTHFDLLNHPAVYDQIRAWIER